MNCAGQSVEACLEGLLYEQDWIDECWGRVETSTVRWTLLAAYLATMVSGGAAIGLLTMLADGVLTNDR